VHEPSEEWESIIASSEWAPKVVDALTQMFSEQKWDSTLNHVELVSATLEENASGSPFLLAIYDHPWWEKRTGLRRRLDRIPSTVPPGMSPEEALAYDIASLDIAEPLGNYYELLVEDENGVWWWGDGFQELTPPGQFR
jgi:hypothetical protein